MSDLIDKLRSEDTPWHPGDPLYMNLRKEAAAEIQRLTEIARLYRIIQHSQSTSEGGK